MSNPASSPCGDDAVTLWRETIPYTGAYFWPVKPTPAAGDSIEGRWLPVAAYQRLVAERDKLRDALEGKCETCDGTGVMEVEVTELPPYGEAVYADEKCAECDGCGKGWVAKIIRERDAAKWECEAAVEWAKKADDDCNKAESERDAAVALLREARDDLESLLSDFPEDYREDKGGDTLARIDAHLAATGTTNRGEG